MSENTAAYASGTLIEERTGLGVRIWDAWRNMRRLIDEGPSEHRLLFYVLLSDMVFFLSWSLKTVVSPVSGVKDYVPLEIGVWLIAALMFRTAVMYLFSLVVWLGCRSGGAGTWKATRIGVFWGALVAAPFGLLMAIATVMMSWLEPVYPILSQEWVQLPPYWISLVPFIWFISQGINEAHGFKRNSISFIIMSVVTLLGMLAAMFMRYG